MEASISSFLNSETLNNVSRSRCTLDWVRNIEDSQSLDKREDVLIQAFQVHVLQEAYMPESPENQNFDENLPIVKTQPEIPERKDW
jgi:hypothetical protein